MANVDETEGRTAHASKSDPQGPSVCCHGTEGGRNLVVNLDGTGNQFGDKNTNVVELYSLLYKDKDQLSLYYSGIGTYARPSWTSFNYYKQAIYHQIDLAIAWEFEKTIMGAYSWLSDNYQDGDRIFLIGFSRGAFQVRALSAMIDKVGLLHKGNTAQVPFAYELYADPLSGHYQGNTVDTSDTDARRTSKAERFKSAFCHKDVKVHFVGAWDTVSSIGLVRKKKLLPGTIDGMKHVCFFRHALALDERRVKFLPEYAYGGTTLPPQHSDSAPPTEDDDYVLCSPFLDAFIYAAVVLFSFPWHLSFLSIAYRLVALYMIFRCLRFTQDVVNLDMESRPDLTDHPEEENPTPSCPGTFQDHWSVDERLNYINWNPAEYIDAENPFKLFPVVEQNAEESSEGSTTSDDDSSEPSSEASTTSEDEDIDEVNDITPQSLEVWFAGTHSDIGGGNVQNKGMDRSRPPLRWMVHEAGALGLRMKPFTRELSSDEHIEVKESLTGPWTVLERLPFRRLTFDGESAGESETYRPHHGAGRVIQRGQKIHASLTLAKKLGKSEPDGYTPKARLSGKLLSEISRLKVIDKDGDFWEKLGDERLRHLLEVDLEQHVKGLLRMYVSKQETQVLNALKKIPTWNDGRQAIYDVCIKLLLMEHTELENTTIAKPVGNPLDNEERYQLLNTVSTLLPVNRLSDVKLEPSRSLHGRLSSLLNNEARKKDTATFILRFTQLMVSVLEYTSNSFSVAFSADGNWLASGHTDGTVQIWDLKSSTSKALSQHSSAVMSIAFSPDSKHLVSGSGDCTISLWDMTKMEQVGDLWKGHTNHGVNCVAFSPDGTKVVSGSDDKTLCVWDPETGKEIAVLEGHERSVQSVAFSPDSLHIASGSDGRTVCIWDSCTYQQVGEPLKGHTGAVWSVAYSHNGKLIVSGSEDKTIRIWDAETRMQVGEPLQGHSNYINSVCFSPDGKLLASGSCDHTIRIWNADTGVQIGEGLRGHGDWVWSVAFSPDGKQLASASNDGTIRIWDVENYLYLHSLQ
ncbi:WD40 repeat-like protein [Agrocybe pediades]|nr:WD40 repeat-like protein [Agrocybe pediades]